MRGTKSEQIPNMRSINGLPPKIPTVCGLGILWDGALGIVSPVHTGMASIILCLGSLGLVHIKMALGIVELVHSGMGFWVM